MEKPDIPAGVYWSREAGNFYSEATNLGMGLAFYDAWEDRKDEFPEKVTGAPGIDLFLDQPVPEVASE